MATVGTFERYTGVWAQKELVTVIINDGTATCDKPCPINGLITSARVRVLGTKLCYYGVDLSGNESKLKAINAKNFPKCGFPTQESVAIFESSQQS